MLPETVRELMALQPSGGADINALKDEPMNELETLTEAHRALAAQHTALMAVCRVMLPLIPATTQQKKRLLYVAGEAYGEHMRRAQQDADYQRMVKDGIEMLSATILAG